MKLPFFTKKEKKEYFLALLLGEEKVSAVIFEEFKGTARIVGKHEEHLKEPLENTPFDTWLEVLDNAISIAESGLPENVQTQKTVFGVKESWVEEAKIKKEYLLKLKRASDALMIIPIGFIVIHEAIAHLLQQQEGAPVSAILIEIGKKMLTITLIRAGRIIETKQTETEQDIVQTTDKLLYHFNYEVMPSRIIVLSDEQNHEKLSQAFVSHTWTKSLPFLHVPQASILPKGFDARAVFLGAASQMGFEVLGRDETHLPDRSRHLEDETAAATEKGDKDFGFLMGADVREGKKEPEVPEVPLSPVTPVSHLEPSLVVPVATTAFFSGSFFHSIAEVIEPIKKTIVHTIKKLHIPSPNLAMLKKTPLLALLAVVVIIVLLASYVMFLKATITLSVKPKIIEKMQSITFTTKSTTDFSKKIIATDSISVTEEGKKTFPATGKKEVGTKAKGPITIYNKTPQKVSLPAGTILSGSNNLTFSLDDNITVASASGASDAFSSISPSTAKGNVTALDLGKESNLPSNTVFSIKSFAASDVAGKNDTAFSGGTKKEVTVISKNDIDKASSTLIKSLEQKAKNDMEQKTNNQNVLLPFITNTEFTKQNTDKKVNDEANSFTLSGNIAYESLTYKKDDMEQFSKKLVQLDLQDNTFTQDSVQFALEDTKDDKGKITSELNVKVSLLPKLDKEKVSQDTAGKSFDQARTTLLSIPQVSSADIALSPNIFFLPRMLPRLSQNITLILKKE